MDVVPKPGQLVAAAGNLAQSLARGGFADLRPMPRTAVGAGARHELHRYDPAEGAQPAGDPVPLDPVPLDPVPLDPVPLDPVPLDPVLLVPPLAAPARCFDLRRGCSMVEHLVGTGRPTYLVEYDEVSLRDRSLDLEGWVRDVLPETIQGVAQHAGGRPVHLVGWSLGGLLAMLTAADRPELPISSLTMLAAPVDVTEVPMHAPLRPLLDPGRGAGLPARLYRIAGGAPAPLRWVAELSAFQRLVTLPLAVATHLDDADWLAQIEAVDRLVAETTAYPGRTYGQLYHRFAQGNALADGSLELGDHRIELAALTAPTLVVAGATDTIAPVDSVRAVVPLLSGAREVRLEIVPGGHLGQLTGRAARDTTWPALDEWLGQWDGRQPTQPDDVPIGTNRRRRHGSGSSRALNR